MKWSDVQAGHKWPALLITLAWAEQHCVVPDGFEKGELFGLVPWQAWCLLNFYRLKPAAKVGQLGPAFHYRRGQVCGPQKCGKAPYTAVHTCVEGVGPALFAGWAEGGETWDCRDHGCGCGWVYEYEPGEAMGMPWPTPLIQITAYSEKQTDNIYRMLRPMIDDGPLRELIPKTGEEFIRLPGGGRIDVVTSDARSRLGAQVTFVPQDETGIWTAANGMIKVSETQRRGLAGMRGRAEETTNAWDPNEGSVAQRTAESKRPDIFRFHPQAPEGLSYRNKVERRRVHRHVYHGCKWIDLDAIEGEAAELLEVDPPQAERFFGNRCVAGEGKAFNAERWDEAATPDYRPPRGALIGVGCDGAQFQDAIAIVGTEIATGFQFVIGVWERPPNAPEGYEHPMDEVDAAMVDAESFYDVWRIYIDPGSYTGNIEPLVQKWQGRWGAEVVNPWRMSRPRETGVAAHNYAVVISKGARGQFSHDGHKVFTRHIKNAVKEKVNVRDENNPKLQLYKITKEHPDSPNKIDAAAAGLLSWECYGDAIAKDATTKPSTEVREVKLREDAGEPTVQRGDITLRGRQYVDQEPGRPRGRRGR